MSIPSRSMPLQTPRLPITTPAPDTLPLPPTPHPAPEPLNDPLPPDIGDLPTPGDPLPAVRPALH